MPDSLVRVSRRGGRIPDVIATNPKRPEARRSVERRRSEGTVAQSPPVAAPALGPAARGRARIHPRPPEKAGPVPGEAVTADDSPFEGGERPRTFLAGLMAGREPVVALGRRKVHPAEGDGADAAVVRSARAGSPAPRPG